MVSLFDIVGNNSNLIFYKNVKKNILILLTQKTALICRILGYFSAELISKNLILVSENVRVMCIFFTRTYIFFKLTVVLREDISTIFVLNPE